jgi:hypothetical protein
MEPISIRTVKSCADKRIRYASSVQQYLSVPAVTLPLDTVVLVLAPAAQLSGIEAGPLSRTAKTSTKTTVPNGRVTAGTLKY